MPRRWLSTRGRKTELKDENSVGLAKNEFNFAFTDSHALTVCCEDRNVEILRPNTSAGHRERSRRRPDLTLLIERPQSSGPAHPKTPLSDRFDASRIGLAFGSPRHPPQDFATISTSMSPQLRQLACCDKDSYLPPPTKAKKWKLNPFFKQKADLQNESPGQLTVLHSENSKLGLPIQRTPWRNPKSPPTAHSQFAESTPPPVPEKDKPYLAFADRSHTQQSESIFPERIVPSVEVKVPVKQSDHPNAVFEDLDSSRQSDLLARRSVAFEHLTILGAINTQNQDPCVPTLQRRVTSPTARTSPEIRFNRANNNRLQKYSLFPVTPTSLRSTCGSPQPGRRRSATAPSSSGAENAEKNKARALWEDTTDIPLSEPKGKCDELEPPPALCTDAESRGSSSSDIFFDVKSFRNSDGQMGQHFEMTRPLSVAVQLVRSKSNARKRQRQQAERENNFQLLSEVTATPNERTIAQLEATTGDVKGLTTSSTVTSSRQALQPAQEAQRHAKSVDNTDKSRKTISEKTSLSRLAILNIGIPSPVFEAAEEVWTQEIHLKHDGLRNTRKDAPLRSVPNQHIPSTAEPSLLKRMNTLKNTHNIPLSKYAPEYVAQELERQTGLKSVRSARAHTESDIYFDPRSTNSHRPVGPARSATLPLPRNPPRSRYATTPTIASTSRSHDDDRPIVVAYVKPAAEVSIARTISLSRRPSAKIMVARSQARNGSRQETEQITERQVNLGLPVVQEVHKKHKPGQSQNLILESVATIPTNSQPPPQNPDSSVPNIHSEESIKSTIS